jgi:HYR domain
MRVRGLIAVCGLLVLCGAPLASARAHAFGDPVGPVEATGPGGANVPFDNGGFSCDHASGDLFPIGTTTVNCTTTDADGNPVSAGSFDVIVQDTTGPVLSGMPGDQPVSTGSPPATVSWPAPSANDLVDGSVSTSCSPSSGSSFASGSTTVTCSATDAHNNSSSASFTVTVTVTDTTNPVITVPGNINDSTTDPSGKVITYNPTATDNIDGSLPVSCSPASGTKFPANGNPTTVTCSATDTHGNTGTNSFTVTIAYIDNVAPVISGMPGDISTTTTVNAPKTVTWPSPTATDNVAGSVPVTCTPNSGSSFPANGSPTTVTCTASDGTNSASASFTVTVTITDTIAPMITNQPNITTTTDVNAPKVVTYTNPTATDNIDGTLPVSCAPASGSTFPQNGSPTTVTCTATDAHGNTGTETFTITVNLVDTTKPVLSSVPGGIAENTEVPTGKVISYTAPTANDNLDGPLGVTCTPASGTNFVVGSTPVTCSATDAHGNKGEATFSVVITLIDITNPVLSNVPGDITTEANGPSGSKANFTPPTAVDNLDGPIPAVPCTPGSGSTFPLGETTVTCSATDAHGNTGNATFKVRVVDTTPPTLIAPGDTSVYATSESGSDGNDQGPITKFVFGFHVADIADPSPKVTSNPPAFFPVGTTTVTFTATDASGNKASASAKLTVLPKPAPGTTPPPLPPPKENTPPGNVQGLVGKGGDGRAIFKWTNPTDADFDHVEITRTTSLTPKAADTGTVVYSGKGTTYTDKGLQNGKEYRYVIVSVDKNGNKSAGVAIVVVPKKAFLKTPADGARLKQLPKRFVWLADPKAAYYNLQLYVGGTLLFKSTAAANPEKILSTWTTAPFFVFKSPWKWEGRSYKMTKGVYTWYVWPGYGAREAAKYGPLMGSATFQVTPAPAKPKAKPKKPKKP